MPARRHILKTSVAAGAGLVLFSLNLEYRLLMNRVRPARTRVMAWFIILALVAVLSASCGFSAHATPTASEVTPSLPSPVSCPGCWRPALKTSWQWQLQGTINQSLNVVMYDVDMFDTSAAVVASLHKAGRIVICYIDAGTWESWRPDANTFPQSVKGKPVSGFSNERWLDIRQQALLDPIMKVRLDLCKSKGFNGVEFDNIDGYTNTTGFPLTASQQLSYNIFLANAAHTRDLSVALKNDLDQVTTLLPYFDWALDEQCFQYQECNKLVPFIKANKAVMEVEYNLSTTQFCPRANAMNFNSMKKHFSLGAYRVACR